MVEKVQCYIDVICAFSSKSKTGKASLDHPAKDPCTMVAHQQTESIQEKAKRARTWGAHVTNIFEVWPSLLGNHCLHPQNLNFEQWEPNSVSFSCSCKCLVSVSQSIGMLLILGWDFVSPRHWVTYWKQCGKIASWLLTPLSWHELDHWWLSLSSMCY